MIYCVFKLPVDVASRRPIYNLQLFALITNQKLKIPNFHYQANSVTPAALISATEEVQPFWRVVESGFLVSIGFLFILIHDIAF